MAKRNTDNTIARRNTDNTMAKRKRTKGKTMIYKTLHRKQQIEQNVFCAFFRNGLIRGDMGVPTATKLSKKSINVGLIYTTVT
jgi:hypothetical protein